MKKIISFVLIAAILISAAVIPASAKESVDIYDYLHQHVLAFEEEIDVSGMGFKVSEFQKLANELSYYLIYNYADLFYFGGIVSGKSLGDEITSFTMHYNYTYQQVEFVREYAIEHYLSKVNPAWSQLEKVLYIHDRLAVDFQYDVRLYDAENYMNAARDIYGMFTDKQGVCQAYSNTFMYLMQALGIECKLVASDATNHEWNVVKVDGEWYHIDVTQDDPVYTISEDGLSDIAGLIEHKYFLESDRSINEALTDGDHYDWYYLDGEPVECTSDKYTKGYIFEDALTAFVPIGNKWYYLEKDGSEIEFEYTRDFIEDEVIFEIPAEWAAEVENAYWPGGYTGLYNAGNWLLYNTDSTVSAINVETKEEMVLYTLDEIKAIDTTIPENNHIYGSKLKDGKIFCQISNEPVSKKYYTLTLDLCEDEHRIVGDWVVIENPTHEKEGLQIKKCEFCGEEVEREILPKREHRLVREPSLDVAATCTQVGKKGYKCMNTGCDYFELRDDDKLADHKWVVDSNNSIDATKENDGLKVEYCEYGCGETKETVIPALGDVTPGDIDNSGTVNAADLAMLKKGIAGIEEIVVEFFDCDGNGIVNAGDLAVLKKFIAGLISAIR